MLFLGFNFGGTPLPWQSPPVFCRYIRDPHAIYVSARYARFPTMLLGLFNKRSNIASSIACLLLSQFWKYTASSLLHDVINADEEVFLGLHLRLLLSPLFFQVVKGTLIMISGVFTLSIDIVQCLTGIATGSLSNIPVGHDKSTSVGHYCEPIWTGMVILALNSGLFFTFDENMSIAKIADIEAVAGVGVGLNFQSLLIALPSHVDPPGSASAIVTFDFTRNIAISLSVFIGGSHPAALADSIGKDLAAKFNSTNAEANVDSVSSLPILGSNIFQRFTVIYMLGNFYLWQ
ncbi:hypothetical protein N7508_006680 [Penicillium antarcticum]|uniref:uncharacterized protein n=1 Tax=Penicillium antarcticum TaxID=416450 RepID=UPI0023A67C51|nr:uncharacterized protein N7508_006680 [Penicillium antarcticum]KAJ5301817.1 hypothetical protein N7508_006680 [Penicillium antarcticum]